MPRFPRKFQKTSYFHVITQGIDKNYIFEKAEDIKYYIKIMYSLSHEHDIKIIAYCIMNNHTHFLVKTDELEELSKYMQRLNTKYARYYNTKYNRIGYVFRDRFKSEGIYNEAHLYNCMRYIYKNPVKAGMCKHESEYPYSNYKKSIKSFEEKDYSFIEVDEDIDNISKEILNNFLIENAIGLQELKKEKEKLKDLVSMLQENNNVSLRKISEITQVNREFLRRLYKKS